MPSQNSAYWAMRFPFMWFFSVHSLVRNSSRDLRCFFPTSGIWIFFCSWKWIPFSPVNLIRFENTETFFITRWVMVILAERFKIPRSVSGSINGVLVPCLAKVLVCPFSFWLICSGTQTNENLLQFQVYFGFRCRLRVFLSYNGWIQRLLLLLEYFIFLFFHRGCFLTALNTIQFCKPQQYCGQSSHAGSIFSPWVGNTIHKISGCTVINLTLFLEIASK